MPNRFFLLTLMITALGCSRGSKREEVSRPRLITGSINLDLGTKEFIYDTVYPNKTYKITLMSFDPMNKDETIPNTLFSISKLINGKYSPIFSDSIFNQIQEVSFEDFNNDNVKDILIQNHSDVRSNWTYHLFLVDTLLDQFTKIKGFENIKNPNYLPQYNLINNYVMSGKIWTRFYKITDETIKSFDIVIYDNQTDDGSYAREYQKAIHSILAIKNHQ